MGLPVADFAAVTSTVIEGAALMLDEAGRESDRERRADDIHAALLMLHDRLRDWLGAAEKTNIIARDWWKQLPESEGRADALFEAARATNIDLGFAVAHALRQPVKVQSRRRRWIWLRVRGGSKEPELTLRSLLRVHAPDVAVDLDAVLMRRGEILRALPEELERRYADGGLRAVQLFVRDMEFTVVTLAESCVRLAAFIRERFPLGTA